MPAINCILWTKNIIIIAILLSLTFLLFSCSTTNNVPSEEMSDLGTFRAKWWNYHDRGILYAEQEKWDNAAEEFKQAISLRSKDQRMARTYGMHFIDYFPHRELGVVYLSKGEIQNAIRELEESARSEESAKAIYYLNRARKVSLQQQKDRIIHPPTIDVDSPSEGIILNSFTVRVKGKVSGAGYISSIAVSDIHYRIDLAKEVIDFDQDIEVDEGENRIVISCRDLLGNIAEKAIKVTVDREGPAISIADIFEEGTKKEKFIRITGEVHDNSGIKKIIVNGKSIDTNNEKMYDLNLFIERKESGTLILQAFDSLENETKAVIDLGKEIASFNKKQDIIQLAFNSDRIFSFDKEPPVISLKDAGNIPFVFVDKYYVEGEVFDNKRVEKIFINSKEISVNKAKKVFFSKIVKLREGENRIAVDVYDSSNNKTSSGFTIRRHLPVIQQVGSRMSVSILPFESRQKSTSSLTQLAYEQLISSFVDHKRFSVVERAKLEQVLIEQKLTKTKLTDPEHSIKVGRLMSADTILVTSIKEDQKSMEVISRIINTETSELMEVKDVYCEDKSLSSVKELMDGLAAKIATSFPVVEGMVVNKEKGFIYTDIGGKSKIKKDMGVIFYRKGKEIKHPVTGKFLGNDVIKLGEGRIEDIQENFSKVKLEDRASHQEINIKDMLITK
jgi:hypothetical protein